MRAARRPAALRALLGYASAATSDPSYIALGKEGLSGCIALDQASPYIKSFTQQTRLVPAFLWFLQTPQAQAVGQ